MRIRGITKEYAKEYANEEKKSVPGSDTDFMHGSSGVSGNCFKSRYKTATTLQYK